MPSGANGYGMRGWWLEVFFITGVRSRRGGCGLIPKNLLPTTYDQYLVAGGWAVCPALASDIDLFVLAGSNVSLPDVRQEILDHLQVEEFDYTEQQDTRTFLGYDGFVGIGKVAMVHQFGLLDIHVLVASTTNPQEILQSFDLSICMIGILPNGRIVKSDAYWTPPTMPPVVVRDTPTTAARLQKYTQRFSFN